MAEARYTEIGLPVAVEFSQPPMGEEGRDAGVEVDHLRGDVLRGHVDRVDRPERGHVGDEGVQQHQLPIELEGQVGERRDRIEPEAQRSLELVGGVRVLPVAIRLLGSEQVQVPLPGGAVGIGCTTPRCWTEVRRPVVGRKIAVLALTIAENVAVTCSGTGLCRKSFLELQHRRLELFDHLLE